MKYFLATITAVFLFGLVLLSPTPALAAYNTVTFDALTTTSVWGTNIDLAISSGGEVAGFTVNSTTLTIDVESGSSITITDTNRGTLANTESAAITCTGDYSSISIVGNRTETITVTPTTALCNSVPPAGGGGGSTYIPPTPVVEEVEEPVVEEATTTAPEVTAPEVEVPSVKSISEMSVAELKVEISKIAVLIAQLQQELLAIIAAEGGQQLTQNLMLDSRGDEVTLLQTWLALDSTVYPEGIVSGWFGPLTKTAVIRFQDKYYEDVLAPWNFSSGTGYVGSTTRSKLNALYGGQ